MQLRWSPAAAEDLFRIDDANREIGAPRIIEYIQQEKASREEKRNGSQERNTGLKTRHYSRARIEAHLTLQNYT